MDDRNILNVNTNVNEIFYSPLNKSQQPNHNSDPDKLLNSNNSVRKYYDNNTPKQVLPIPYSQST